MLKSKTAKVLAGGLVATVTASLGAVAFSLVGYPILAVITAVLILLAWLVLLALTASSIINLED
jgi:hypothetical protein